MQPAHGVCIGLQIVDAVAAVRRNERLCGEKARLDRRENALATLRIREPRRIADEDDAASDERPRPYARCEVGMAAPPQRGATTQHAVGLQECNESIEVSVEPVADAAADAHVEIRA